MFPTFSLMQTWSGQPDVLFVTIVSGIRLTASMDSTTCGADLGRGGEGGERGEGGREGEEVEEGGREEEGRQRSRRGEERRWGRVAR